MREKINDGLTNQQRWYLKHKNDPKVRAQQKRSREQWRAKHPTYDAEYEKNHREMHNAKTREWRIKNPEKARELGREYARSYRRKYPERYQVYDRRKRLKEYGLTPDSYQQMVEQQNGQCAICKAVRKLHIDHDHKTGKVRGLLCAGCNHCLHQFDELFEETLQYLGLRSTFHGDK